MQKNSNIDEQRREYSGKEMPVSVVLLIIRMHLFCSECGTRLNQEADHVGAGKFDENVNLDENAGADEDE